MPPTNTQPPTTTPNPAPIGPPPVGEAPHNGGGWGMAVGAAIAIVIIAGGVYYFLTQEGYPLAPQQEEQNTAPAEDDSIDSIEADLNSQSDANVESDLSNLEQSL